jgi:hypothetical protein
MEALFNISLPTSWQSLSDRQLIFFFRQLSRNLPFSQILTLCLLRWGNLRILGKQDGNYLVKQRAKPKSEAALSLWQIHDATNSLAYLQTFPTTPVRLTTIGKAEALQADFQGVPFSTFIAVDNYYQGFLQTQQYDLLKQAASLLYPNVTLKRLSTAHCLMVFYWITALKQYLSRLFPHFLQSAPKESDNLLGSSNNETIRSAVNAQIRALTGGDITKEAAVLAMDTWRALTELDAKASEAEKISAAHK